ncbi:LysR family transcriptional regulator [Desulfonema ishimotonii]|uniref:LysR family transcriptional regulator n=1 Tax=Desulfonema ishimotonii TaxID=45657 RepID=A0A401FXE9_9BACT|nr:LysR family transcriptional regulator [Desulfonema ishimotonii]GBC61641.1 LysR family transcriptional regulator [Desulfonema ishimotonii]
MEIRHFKTLRAIVEKGSFIKASEALNYAQSSVTSHIQAIEEYYGQPVFDRIGRRVVLNVFGKTVYSHAIRLLETYDTVCNLTADADRPSGKLRIGAPESTMIYRLYPVLWQYKEMYPDVEIIMQNFICPRMRGALRTGELDLAILLEPRRADADLCIDELIQEEMSIVLPGDYPNRQLTSTAGLAVLYTEKGCSYREIFQGLLAKQGIHAENIVETGSIEVIRRYVLCGIGLSFLPTITVREEIESGAIRHIPWQNDPPVMIQLARHKDKWITPAMRAFIRLTIEHAKEW